MPVGIAQAPGDAGHFYVWQQADTCAHRRDRPTSAATVSRRRDRRERAELGSGGNGLLGLAFSPGWATNHTAYLSYFTPSRPRPPRASTRSSRASPRRRRRQFDVGQRSSRCSARSAVHQPQRRQHPVRARRLPLLRLRRRRLGRRSRQPRAGSDAVVRQDAAPRRRRADDLRHPADQPVRRQRDRQRADLRLRPAQPVALELRPRHRRPVGRRRRPERVGRGRQGAARRQLRLEQMRRQPHTTRPTPAAPTPDRADRPASIAPVVDYSHSDPIGGNSITGGYVYRGTAHARPGRQLPLRRLRLGPAVARSASTRSTGRRRTSCCSRPARTSSRSARTSTASSTRSATATASSTSSCRRRRRRRPTSSRRRCRRPAASRPNVPAQAVGDRYSPTTSTRRCGPTAPTSAAGCSCPTGGPHPRQRRRRLGSCPSAPCS